MSNIKNTYRSSFHSGDAQAFKQIFERYYKILCSYVYDFIKNPTTTDDIVQDLFIRLWEKKIDFDCQEKISAFLFTSARNACINLMRHENMKIEKLKNWEQDSETYHSEDHLLMEEFDCKLEHWLNSLPIECRKIIELSIEGKKNQEIADLLQISINTVKNQKVKGFKILRTLYKDEYLLFILYITHSYLFK